MRFFGSVNKSIGSGDIDLFSDPLEADQKIAVGFHEVAVRDSPHQGGGYERRHDKVVRGQSSGRLPFRQHIFAQQAANLVSRKSRPRAAGIHRYRCGTADPVTVGVAGQRDVRADFAATVDNRVKDRRVFRI